jgi:hypothetical protein
MQHLFDEKSKALVNKMVLAHEAMAVSQPRVPAWKRVGLKLKYAKETAEPQSNDTTPKAEIKATKSSEIPETSTSDQRLDQRPVKKRRVSKEPSIRNAEVDHGDPIKPNDYSNNSNRNGFRKDTEPADAVESSQNDQAVQPKEYVRHHVCTNFSQIDGCSSCCHSLDSETLERSQCFLGYAAES